MKPISEKIAIARKNKNMTQTDVARKVSITPQMVSRWENGESLPDVTMLGKLAQTFEVPIAYFYGDAEIDSGVEGNRQKTKSRAKLNDYKWSNDDFTSLSLTDFDFTYARFSGCNFTNCNMSSKDFSYIEFISCNLQSAVFKNTKMCYADIIECNLGSTDFTNARFEKSDFNKCSFMGAIFTNVTLEQTDFTNCIFEKIDFTTTVFNKCKFKNTIFNDCTVDRLTYNFLQKCKVDISGVRIKG